MNIDWGVAVFLFIVFVAWSLVYFSGLETQGYEGSFAAEAGKVMESVSANVYRVPAIYNSSYSGNALLYAVMDWRGGEKNSTRVYSGNRTLDCMISGDMVVWEAGVNEGNNRFVIEYSDNREPMNCTAMFSGVFNQSVAGVKEHKKEISIDKVKTLMDSDYERVRENTGIDNDFRIEIETGKESFAYGPTPPVNVDIHSIEKNMLIAGGGGFAKVRVLIW